MKVIAIIVFVFFSIQLVFSDTNPLIVKRGFVFQYAGSTGYASVGYMLGTKNVTELSSSYGFTPQFAGGPLHTINLKLSFNLKKIPLYNNVKLSPLLVGAFVTLTFNENLGFSWKEYYPDDYYWWQRNFRQHIFVASQIEFPISFLKMNKIAFYFEGNSNDLYMVSHFTNRKSLKISDIIFFGAGIKVYRE